MPWRIEPADRTQDEIAALPKGIEPMKAMIADAPSLGKGMALGNQVGWRAGAKLH